MAASNPSEDKTDYMKNCSICFETYTTDGEHLPRLLPCGHTFCEKCIEECLVDNDTLNCSECNVEHNAEKGTSSFVPNKYVIGYLERAPENQPDPKEEKRELMDKVENLKSAIENKKKKLSTFHQELEKRNKECISGMKRRKNLLIDSINENFNELFDKVEESKKQCQKKFNEKQEAYQKYLAFLGTIEDDVMQSDPKKAEILRRINAVKKASDKPNRLQYVCRYYVSSPTTSEMEVLCGHVTTTPGNFTETVTKEMKSSCTYLTALCSLSNNTVVVATKQFRNKLHQYSLTTEDVTTIGIASEASGLLEVNLAGQKCLAVSYANEYIFSRRRRVIEFRDINDLRTVVTRYNTAPNFPHVICAPVPAALETASAGATGRDPPLAPGHNPPEDSGTASAGASGSDSAGCSRLYYVHEGDDEQRVFGLDCRVNPPVPLPESTSLSAGKIERIKGMCCVTYGDRELFVVTFLRGVVAFVSGTGAVEWRKDWRKGTYTWTNPISTDGRGRIFTSSKDNTEVLAMSNTGIAMGWVLEESVNGLGSLRHVFWSEDMLSLIIAHTQAVRDEKTYQWSSIPKFSVFRSDELNQLKDKEEEISVSEEKKQ